MWYAPIIPVLWELLLGGSWGLVGYSVQSNWEAPSSVRDHVSKKSGGKYLRMKPDIDLEHPHTHIHLNTRANAHESQKES